jgi:hypothetical protein
MWIYTSTREQLYLYLTDGADMIRNSSFSKPNRLWSLTTRVCFRQGQKIFLFHMSRPALSSTHPPV